MVKTTHPMQLGLAMFETGLETLDEMTFKTPRTESRQKNDCETHPEANNDFHFIGASVCDDRFWPRPYRCRLLSRPSVPACS